MRSQRKKGITLSYINMIFGIILGLLNSKIIVQFVSQSDIGVYATLGSLIAVMGILDFGFAGTIIRYYTKSLALENEIDQQNTLATGALIYVVISMIIVIVGFLLFPLIEIIYKVSFTDPQLILAKRIFIIMIINFVLSICTNVYNAVITSHERFVFANAIGIAKAIISPILIYMLLYKTGNIMVVVIIHTTVNILGIVAKILYSHVNLKIVIKFHYFDKKLFAAITGFAFFVFLNMVMDKLYWSTDNLILTAVAGPVMTSVYAYSGTLTRYYLNFSSQIASVFLPKITTISTNTDDMTELNEIFLKVGRFQYIIIMLILSGFIIFGKEFITDYWLNENFENAYYFALILMIPLVVPLIQNTGISILQAKNKHRFRSIIYVLIAILNFALSIPLAKVYGGYGCAIATAGSLILGQWVIINLYYKKKIGIAVGIFFKHIIKMSLPMIIVASLSYYLNSLVVYTGFIVFLVKVLIYTGAYLLAVGKFSCNDYERDIFMGILNKLTKRKTV